MSPEELVEAIERSGGVVELAGRMDRVRYRLPVSAAMLLDDLRRMKPEVIPVLRRRAFTYLMPFLGKRVWTPDGPGILVALEDYAAIAMATGEKRRCYEAGAIIPYA
jgi:hypothetical protein